MPRVWGRDCPGSREVEHRLGMAGGKAPISPPPEGHPPPPPPPPPLNYKTWGVSLGRPRGAALAVVLVPFNLQPAIRQAGGWGWRGSAALSPQGCPGLPVSPTGPWGDAVLLGRVSPSPLLASAALARHSLFLAALLPERAVEIVCGPLGCSWGSGIPGGPWGPVPSPAARLPARLQRRLPAGRAAARPPPSPPHGPSGSRLQNWGGGTRHSGV